MWWYLIIFLPVAVVLWLLYEWYEHRSVKYSTTTVEFQQLPANIELRLCLMSDLHNNKKDLERLVTSIREFAPDVILLAGDLVNKHKPENKQAEEFLSALARLSVPVYYSEGNHELSLAETYPECWHRYLTAIHKKAAYLQNEAVCLNGSESVYISGLSLPKEYYKKGNLYENTALLPELSVPENAFHIMMAHNPEYASLYDKYHADLILSGHLHGGLLRLPFIGGVVSPRLRLPKGCDAGLVQLPKGNYMFVSRGLGSHTIPLRFFNRVEVNFLILKGIGNKNTVNQKEME